MKQKFLFMNLCVIMSFYFTSCITVAPVHGTYEKAGTMGKGNIELSGNYTHYAVSGGGEAESINNNYGIRAGYGVSDKVDIKLRYEKLVPVNMEPGTDFKANYISIIPKFNFSHNKLSLFIPISRYNFSSKSNIQKYSTSSYSIAPHLIRTFTSKSNKVDFSTSANLEYIINKGEDSENDFLMGLNIGAGFSSDLNKWALRPEIGYFFKPGESASLWNVGLGLQFILPTKKASK